MMSYLTMPHFTMPLLAETSVWPRRIVLRHVHCRPMRKGEADGVDYVFVSRQQFEQWIRDDELVEHALVYGEYKGIPRGHITSALAAGSDVVLRVDVQGAATIKRMIPSAILIFIVRPIHPRPLAQQLSDNMGSRTDGVGPGASRHCKADGGHALLDEPLQVQSM